MGLVQITANFLINLESPGSLENLLFQGIESFVELPNFPFSDEGVTGVDLYGIQYDYAPKQIDEMHQAIQLHNLKLDVLRAPELNMNLWK